MSATQSAVDHLTGGPRKTRARMALALVAVALIALAIVPIYIGQRATEAQEQITEYLQPALLASAKLSLAQADLVDLLQRFLLGGEGLYRTQYNAAVLIEDSLTGVLSDHVRGMDFDVRERLAQLSAESARWHFENRRVFDVLDEAGDADDAEKEDHAPDEAENDHDGALGAVEDGGRDLGLLSAYVRNRRDEEQHQAQPGYAHSSMKHCVPPMDVRQRGRFPYDL